MNLFVKGRFIYYVTLKKTNFIFRTTNRGIKKIFDGIWIFYGRKYLERVIFKNPSKIFIHREVWPTLAFPRHTLKKILLLFELSKNLNLNKWMTPYECHEESHESKEWKKSELIEEEVMNSLYSMIITAVDY